MEARHYRIAKSVCNDSPLVEDGIAGGEDQSGAGLFMAVGKAGEPAEHVIAVDPNIGRNCLGQRRPA